MNIDVACTCQLHMSWPFEAWHWEANITITGSISPAALISRLLDSNQLPVFWTEIPISKHPQNKLQQSQLRTRCLCFEEGSQHYLRLFLLKAAKLKKHRLCFRCVVENDAAFQVRLMDFWGFSALKWRVSATLWSFKFNSSRSLLWESCSWSVQWASTCLDASLKCRTVPLCHQRVPLESLKRKQPLTTITKICYHYVYKSWNLGWSTIFYTV